MSRKVIQMDVNGKDFGTPEQMKKRKVRIVNGLARVESQLVVDDLYRVGLIDSNQFYAATRVLSLFVFSGLADVVGFRVNDYKPRLAALFDERDKQEEYEQLYNLVMSYIRNHAERCAVRKVVCFNELPKPVEVKRLRGGLDVVDKFFRRKQQK